MEGMRTRRPNINEDIYNNIKLLTNHGLSSSEITKINGYKESVITNVRNTDDYDQYRKLLNQYRIAKNNKSEQIAIPIASSKIKEVPVPAVTKIDGIAELTKEIKMLREAIYVMRSDNKKGWFNGRN